MKIVASLLLLLAVSLPPTSAAQELQQTTTSANSTSSVKKLFTYAGPLLPSDWSLVSVVNDRAIIGFTNGSARNVPMVELEAKDRAFVERLQNGTVYSTPLASAKEKLSQWGSQVSATVSKLSKSVKEQFDHLLNNDNKDNKANVTSSSSSSMTVDTTIIN